MLYNYFSYGYVSIIAELSDCRLSGAVYVVYEENNFLRKAATEYNIIEIWFYTIAPNRDCGPAAWLFACVFCVNYITGVFKKITLKQQKCS